MSEMHYSIDDVPCMIRITDWEPHRPAKVGAAPEDCYPAEGGYGSWEVYDMEGKPAPWLEKRMSPSDVRLLEERMFDFMESGQ